MFLLLLLAPAANDPPVAWSDEPPAAWTEQSYDGFCCSVKASGRGRLYIGVQAPAGNDLDFAVPAGWNGKQSGVYDCWADSVGNLWMQPRKEVSRSANPFSTRPTPAQPAVVFSTPSPDGFPAAGTRILVHSTGLFGTTNCAPGKG